MCVELTYFTVFIPHEVHAVLGCYLNLRLFELPWSLIIILKVGFFVISVPKSLKYLWNDHLILSLIKRVSSMLKAGKLRQWAPHLASELSFYSLGQNCQPRSNLLYIMDKVCFSCCFGKFQKQYFEPLGRCINNEDGSKCFLK